MYKHSQHPTTSARFFNENCCIRTYMRVRARAHTHTHTHTHSHWYLIILYNVVFIYLYSYLPIFIYSSILSHRIFPVMSKANQNKTICDFIHDGHSGSGRERNIK
jgi:hypothetical protein